MFHGRFTLTVLSMVLALSGALAPSVARAQLNVSPPELTGVGVDEHLDRSLPMDAIFTDHNGRQVRLGDYFDGRRPVMLNIVYHRCPMLCGMVLNATLQVLREQSWSVGQQFTALTVSIDPRDTTEVASQKRQRVLAAYNRPTAASGWNFLTGSPDSVRRLTEAAGFRYRYDARQDQYAHPAVLMLVTPNGHMARYLYGIHFQLNDVRLGLLEASQGRSVTTVERLIMYCYHYDPQGQRYAIMAQNVMRLGGVITVLLLGGLITGLRLRERKRKGTAESFNTVSLDRSLDDPGLRRSQ